MIVTQAENEGRGFCHVCKDGSSSLCIDTPFIIVRLCVKCAESVADEIHSAIGRNDRKRAEDAEESLRHVRSMLPQGGAMLFKTNIGTKG